LERRPRRRRARAHSARSSRPPARRSARSRMAASSGASAWPAGGPAGVVCPFVGRSSSSAVSQSRFEKQGVRGARPLQTTLFRQSLRVFAAANDTRARPHAQAGSYPRAWPRSLAGRNSALESLNLMPWYNGRRRHGAEGGLSSAPT
jgi:hypothetical protein